MEVHQRISPQRLQRLLHNMAWNTLVNPHRSPQKRHCSIPVTQTDLTLT